MLSPSAPLRTGSVSRERESFAFMTCRPHRITAALQAAGAEWNRHLVGSGSLEVEVSMANIPTMDGTSVSSGFVRNNGTRDIFEQGAAFEIRKGTDPNGADPDIRIRIGTAYLTDQLWFDPNPQTRTDPIPANHIDAMSVFIHELGARLCLQRLDERDNRTAPAHLHVYL